MHPAWAGAGGNWPAIDEVADSTVVRQQSEFSCAAACAKMLLREQGINVAQAAIAEITGVPTAPGELASALNQFDPGTSGQWKGGFLDLPGATAWEVVEILNNTNSINLNYRYGSDSPLNSGASDVICSFILGNWYKTGLWAAVFWEVGARMGHMVMVEGINEIGDVLIRDPWEGTRYRMRREDFLRYWNLTGVYWRRQ